MTRLSIFAMSMIVALALFAMTAPSAQAGALPAVSGSSLVFHIDAGDISGLSDGDPVSTWTAAAGPNASQGNADYQPVYRASATPMGTAGVDFDQDNDHLDLDSAMGDAASIFFVVQYKEFGEQQMMMGNSAASQKFGHRSGVLFMDGVNYAPRAFSSTDTHVHSWQKNASGNPGTWLEDGVDIGGTVQTFSFTGGSVIGAERSAVHQWGADNLGPAAVISEIVAYDTELSASDRAAVSAHLVAKHIIPEPSSLVLVCLSGLLALRRRSR